MEWGHPRVRQMLRTVRIPGAAQRDPLALRLQRLTGAPTARDAVTRVIERALSGYPPVYWLIVRRTDLEGESTQAVADEIYLSARSFFRYRSAAIAAIAAEIEALTRAGSPHVGGPGDLDAFALYARGRYVWRQRTASSFQRALQYYDRSLEVDPGFARAYAGIADVHLLRGEHVIRDSAGAFAAARAAASTALALDESLPEAHATLADLAMFQSRDPRRAKASFDLALSVDPNYTSAHHFAAWIAMFDGDIGGAVKHLHTALAREPNSLELHASLAKAYNKQGRPDVAIAHLSDVLDLDPSFCFARCELVRVLVSVARYAEAAEHLTALLAAEDRPTYRAMARFVDARLGRPATARAYLRHADPDPRGHAHFFRALAHLALDAHDDALHELLLSVRAGEPWAIGLRTDIFFRALHGDREFDAIVAEMATTPPLRAAG